jgi:hypothetical protein
MEVPVKSLKNFAIGFGSLYVIIWLIIWPMGFEPTPKHMFAVAIGDATLWCVIMAISSLMEFRRLTREQNRQEQR